MEIKKELITPKKAKELLDKSRGFSNRKIKVEAVKMLTRDIIDGNWQQDNAETIKITSKGVVIDGQHRLTAIINAKKGVKLWVARGVKESTVDTIDRGSIRSIRDVLSMHGYRDPSVTQTAFRLIKAYLDSGMVSMASKKTKYSSNEVLSFIEDNQRLRDGIGIIARKKNKLIVSAAHFCALYYILEDEYIPKFNEFMNRAGLGLAIEPNCPCGAFRELIIKMKSENKTSRKFTAFHTLIVFWNHFISGERRKNFKVDEEPVHVIGSRFYELA